MKVMNDDENVDLSSKIAVTKYLKARVRQLIARANKEWDDLHADDEQPQERLLPLIRIRVSFFQKSRGLAAEVTSTRLTTVADRKAPHNSRLGTLSALVKISSTKWRTLETLFNFTAAPPFVPRRWRLTSRIRRQSIFRTVTTLKSGLRNSKCRRSSRNTSRRRI